MKSDKNVTKGILMISQVGISMITPILLCIFIGYQLDKYFNTKFCIILFLVLGILAAFRNVYLLTAEFYAKDKKKEDEELKYFSDLKNQNNDKTK